MKYIDNHTGEVISEERAYELASEDIDWSDLAERMDTYFSPISILQELQRLESHLFDSIMELTIEDYIDSRFEEVYDEEEDDE